MSDLYSNDRGRKISIINVCIISLVLVVSLWFVLVIDQSYSSPQEGGKGEVTQLVRGQKYKTGIIKDATESPTSGKVVYLTFDDGPSELTDQFLDVLYEHDVKATFFMQGRNLKKGALKESVKRVAKEGHYVGGHSMTHVFQTLYTSKQFVPEMVENLNIIYEITGIHSSLVRPPYGSAPGLKNESIRNEIAASGIKVWDWTIDSKDWALKDEPSQIVKNIKKETNADIEVVLLHEKTQTLQVLPEIITFFREAGYEFGVYDEEKHFMLNFFNDVRF